jgi:hypothetical protein
MVGHHRPIYMTTLEMVTTHTLTSTCGHVVLATQNQWFAHTAHLCCCTYVFNHYEGRAAGRGTIYHNNNIELGEVLV